MSPPAPQCHGVPGVDKGGNVRNLGYVPKETIENLKDFVFKGPFRDQGMPDFTGKLTEADVTKIAGLHPGHRGRDPAEAGEATGQAKQYPTRHGRAVPAIHVFDLYAQRKTWMPGVGEREATPSSRRLCPGMTEER